MQSLHLKLNCSFPYVAFSKSGGYIIFILVWVKRTLWMD